MGIDFLIFKAGSPHESVSASDSLLNSKKGAKMKNFLDFTGWFISTMAAAVISAVFIPMIGVGLDSGHLLGLELCLSIGGGSGIYLLFQERKIAALSKLMVPKKAKRKKSEPRLIQAFNAS